MWTQIRLLLEEQSDLGPHFLRISKIRFEKFARIFSRRHKQTFSDAGFLGVLRVKRNGYIFIANPHTLARNFCAKQIFMRMDFDCSAHNLGPFLVLFDTPLPPHTLHKQHPHFPDILQPSQGEIFSEYLYISCHRILYANKFYNDVSKQCMANLLKFQTHYSILCWD